MSQFAQCDFDRNVITVVVNRPDLHNAFNEVMIGELVDAFVEAGRREDVRVVLLRSEGKSFCAGADVHWMKRMVDYSLEENVADANTLAKMLRTIRECPKPVIARVHGAAIGGGVGLVAACDMAVAVSSAVFSLSEVRLGIIPAVISPFVLEKIGMSAMRRYALTAERFSASDAKRIGLVNEVFESVEEMDRWIGEITKMLVQNGPEALALCKRILNDVQGLTWDTVQVLTTRAIAERRVSLEGQEGLKSFLEKRSPKWTSSE